MFAAVWGSPFVVDGKVYLGDEDGDVVVLQHGKEKKVLAEMNMGSAVYATVVPANGTLFINNRNQLFATRGEMKSARRFAGAARRVLAGRVAALGASSPRLRPASPADAWPQFRGSPRQTGISPSTPPATLKLLWTYDAGEIDRIVGGDCRRRRVCRRRRRRSAGPRPRLRHAAMEVHHRTTLIGESSPAVGGGVVYIGDLGGIAPRRQRRGRQAALDVQDRCRKSNRRPWSSNDVVLIGSYDGNLYALDARSRQTRWKIATKGMVHATPAVLEGAHLSSAAATTSSGRSASPTAARCTRSTSAPTPELRRSIDGDRAYFGTFDNEMLAVDLKARKVLWRFADPDRQFPVLLLGRR